MGDVDLDAGDGVRVTQPVPFDSPAYKAGLERDDVLISIGGASVTTPEDVGKALHAHKPGSSVPIVFRRRGKQQSADVRLIEDPRIEVVTAEQAGETLTESQRQFREQWLSSGRRGF